MPDSRVHETPGLPHAVVAALLVALPASSGTTAASGAVTLRVMSFNIFYGGDALNLQTRQFCRDAVGCPETLDQVAEAIRASGADVVGLEEATMNTCPLAEKLGWHCSPRTQIISRYPIIDPPKANGLYLFVEPSPGRVVAVSDVHLPADPYGPYEIRDGATLAEVLELENDLRVPDIQDELRAPSPASRGLPALPRARKVEVHDRIDWVLSRDRQQSRRRGRQSEHGHRGRPVALGSSRHRLDSRGDARADARSRRGRGAQPRPGADTPCSLPRWRECGPRARRHHRDGAIHRRRCGWHALVRDDESCARRVPGRPAQLFRPSPVPLPVLALRARLGDHGEDGQVGLQGGRADQGLLEGCTRG